MGSGLDSWRIEGVDGVMGGSMLPQGTSFAAAAAAAWPSHWWIIRTQRLWP